jgi:polyisoprenoid-binding protein YceI
MRVRRWLVAVAAVMVMPGAALAKTYTVDRDHSSVGFRVRHLFTDVQGRFRDFQGTIQFDPANPSVTQVKGVISAKSVDTDNEKRDEHLRGSDFFAAGEFPEIRFESDRVTDVDKAAGSAKIHGNLTMHGVTKPVALNARFLGEAADPWGNQKAGFSAEVTIDRREWGLTWNKALETGNVLVGNDVTIRIDVEAKAESAAK